MSRAIVQDGFDTVNPLSKLKLVTRPVPKAAAGQVVVHITLRPVNPTGWGKNELLTDGKGCVGSEGFGIVHQVCILYMEQNYHALLVPLEITKPIDYALEFGYHSVEGVFLKWEVKSENILDTDFAHKVAIMYLWLEASYL
jgi:hypothetical protein